MSEEQGTVGSGPYVKVLAEDLTALLGASLVYLGALNDDLFTLTEAMLVTNLGDAIERVQAIVTTSTKAGSETTP